MAGRLEVVQVCGQAEWSMLFAKPNMFDETWEINSQLRLRLRVRSGVATQEIHCQRDSRITCWTVANNQEQLHGQLHIS